MTRLKQRHILVDCADYFTCVDEFEVDGAPMLLMHIDVHRYAPTVLKSLRRHWAAFRSCTDAPLFAIEPEPDDAKWERFVTSFGFQFSSRVDCPDGLSRRVFISFKDGTENHLSGDRDEDPVDRADRLPH